MTFSGGNAGQRAQLTDLVSQMDAIHGVQDDGLVPVKVLIKKKTGQTGGSFGPGTKGVKDPKIIVRVGDPQEAIISFLHEYGHRVDWDDTQPGGMAAGGGGFKSSAWAHGHLSEQPEIDDLFTGFIEAARDNDHYQTSLAKMGTKYKKYHDHHNEIWARAYAQWSAGKLGGDAGSALDAAWNGPHNYQQWPSDVFADTIAPAFEAVMIARGLLPGGTL